MTLIRIVIATESEKNYSDKKISLNHKNLNVT
jgi:hypothetical protein